MAKRNGWITVRGIIIAVAVILLAVGIWGGLRIASERGERARIEVAQQKAQDSIDQEAKKEQEKSDSEVAKNDDKESKPGNEQSSDNSSSSDVAVSSQGSVRVDEMPQTGSSAGSIFAIGLITFAVVSFLRSRQLP